MAKKTKNLFTLMQPVVRKDSEIGQVEITGAISQAGSLRGLNLIRVANMDADSIATLLTRVTAPALTQKEINVFDPIFPDTCYHLTHYWYAAADIPVASDNPAHYADAIRYNARTLPQGSLLPLTRRV
ncbi:hypothetical protein AI2709V1_2979 [Klebsiella pneumoniae]|nr:hypothetical protein AI2709V1_2979 [Klebsiella pneumoniae]CAH3566716.1 hypothetical protein AI2709V1_2979 [Klebsiella pneumoniae]